MCEKHSYEDLLPAADREWLVSSLEQLKEISLDCVTKSVPCNSVVAYSAGIDSSILANLMMRVKGKARLLTIGRSGSSDVKAALQDPLVSRPGYRLVMENISIHNIQSAATEVSELVAVSNLPHFEDCVSFWLTARAADKMEGIKYILSANGPDELYCGYDRFRRILDDKGYEAVQSEITEALESALKLKRQVATVVSEFGFETREPFLEEQFKKYALGIRPEFKILKGNDTLRKRLWRCLGRYLGIPEITVVRQKKAMQYGMGIHAVVLSMVKKEKICIKSERD